MPAGRPARVAPRAVTGTDASERVTVFTLGPGRGSNPFTAGFRRASIAARPRHGAPYLLAVFIRQVYVAVKKNPKYRFNLDRRSGGDRRSGKNFQFVQQLISGQRIIARRNSDRARIVYFDRYDSKLIRVIIAVLALSVADAVLTVRLIGLGAVEINPLMAYYLKLGPHGFMAVKYVLTSLSVFILVIYSNSGLKRGRHSIRAVFPWIITVFAAVVVWEIYLMVKVAL